MSSSALRMRLCVVVADRLYVTVLTTRFVSLLSVQDKVIIRSKKLIKNHLLKRRQFVIEVIHPGKANVSKADLTASSPAAAAAAAQSQSQSPPSSCNSFFSYVCFVSVCDFVVPWKRCVCRAAGFRCCCCASLLLSSCFRLVAPLCYYRPRSRASTIATRRRSSCSVSATSSVEAAPLASASSTTAWRP